MLSISNSEQVSECVCRDVVHYMASCFYESETWEDMTLDKDSEDSFKQQAKNCAKESLKTLYDPSISELVCIYTDI